MKLIDADELKKQIIFEFGYHMEAGILSIIDDQPEVLLNRNSKGEITQTNDEWRRTCSTEEFSEWL